MNFKIIFLFSTLFQLIICQGWFRKAFSSKIKVINSSSTTIIADFETIIISSAAQYITPQIDTLYVPVTQSKCTIFLDQNHYAIFNIQRGSWFSTPYFILPRNDDGSFQTVVNGEVSKTDEFIRFGNGTNGFSFKFVTESSGMPPTKIQKLKIYEADKSDTKK